MRTKQRGHILRMIPSAPLLIPAPTSACDADATHRIRSASLSPPRALTNAPCRAAARVCVTFTETLSLGVAYPRDSHPLRYPTRCLGCQRKTCLGCDRQLLAAG